MNMNGQCKGCEYNTYKAHVGKEEGIIHEIELGQKYSYSFGLCHHEHINSE